MCDRQELFCGVLTKSVQPIVYMGLCGIKQGDAAPCITLW